MDGLSTTWGWRGRRREAVRPPGAGGWLRRAAGALRQASGPADQRPELTGRAIAADIALVVVAIAAGLAVAAYRASHQAPAGMPVPVPVGNVARAALHHQGWWWLALLATAARMIPLAWRRLFPLAALWLSLGACALIRMPGANVIDFIALVPAGYSAVAHSRHRGVAVVSAAAALWVLAFPQQGQPSNYTLLLAFLILIPALIVGNVSYQWRRRLERLNAEHEAATRRALELERARLASELHDVVTHNVSVMIVQAGAARQVLADAPDDARKALLAVEASGRAAMTELRHLLGLLSPPRGENGEGAADGGGASAREDLRPQPGLGQLRRLIDRVSAAGLAVDLRVGDLPTGLPPGVDLAAFRVVQEALTNVIKHASGPRTSVSVDYRDGDLLVEVADAGPTDRGAPAAGPAMPGTGRGLLGLRERAELYGGELEAGPRPDGGWLVRARIPAGLLPAGGRQMTGAREPAGDTVAAAGQAGEPPRVVIADDQNLVRSGFRMILGAAGIPVVAEAADGGQAVAAVLKHRPDVALMDIRMPEMDGLEATRRILAARAGSDCRIIILTTFDLDQYVYEAITAGASGFLLKDVSPEQLVAAVRLVRSGDALLAPSITRRLVERFAPASAGPLAGGRELSDLTPRELEVLRWLARGLSNAELAAELTLSEATVKTHVARILAKLGLRDRVQAVVLAYETGLAAPRTPPPTA